MDRVMWRLVALNTLCSLGHHVDHALRHNDGWPMNEHVTPFTYGLGFYVMILIGTVLSRREVVGPGFWAVVATVGIAFIGLTHYGPIAEDPPSAFAAAYGSQTKAAIATAWLWLFLGSLTTAAVYSTRRWALLRRGAPSAGVVA